MGVEQTGRALQLVDNDPFRAVDDKHAILSHERQGAKKDLLLFDVTDRPGAGLGIDVKADQPHRDFDRGLEGHPPFNAFGDGILWFPKRVANEFKGTETIEIGDREDGMKDTLQPMFLALIRRRVLLQKVLVRFPLHGNEMWRFDDLARLGKTLTYSFHIFLETLRMARTSSDNY